MKTLLVICNAPDPECAGLIARTLVSRQLAACVNVLAPCRSVYRWKGAVEEAEEIPLLIKTTTGAYAALEAAILALHPYEVPEIIALDPDRGLPAYLRWVEDSLVQDTP